MNHHTMIYEKNKLFIFKKKSYPNIVTVVHLLPIIYNFFFKNMKIQSYRI